MKVRPGVVTALDDLNSIEFMNSSRENVRIQTKHLVKKKIRDILCNAIITHNWANLSSGIQVMIHAGLLNLQRQDIIRDFVVESVEVTGHKPFREVDCLPITAKPGDPLIVDHVDENGELIEVYRGVIISTDGEGKGTVFSQPRGLDKEGQIRARCSVRPMAVLESIVIEIQQEY